MGDEGGEQLGDGRVIAHETAQVDGRHRVDDRLRVPQHLVIIILSGNYGNYYHKNHSHIYKRSTNNNRDNNNNEKHVNHYILYFVYFICEKTTTVKL